MMPTELTVSLMGYECKDRDRNVDILDIPNANEVDIDVHRECLLECGALLPSGLISLEEHLVCKRYLLMIACRKEANLMTTDHQYI